MGDCMVDSTWWPTVLVALLIGVAIGMFVAGWYWRETNREHARYLHPSWSEHGDKGGQGEAWEQPGLWDG